MPGSENSAVVMARIRRLLVDEVEVSAETAASLDSNAPLLGQGIGLDSFEALLLVTALERAFEIEFADSELDAGLFKSLHHLSAVVAAKKNGDSA